MKFIAVQTGARRGYAVPAILERAGMLERFYTDVCGTVGLGAAAAHLRHLPGLGRTLGKLQSRSVPPAVAAKTQTFGGPVLRRALGGLRRSHDPAAALHRGVAFARHWGDAMVRAGFGDATHVFSMLGEGGPFLAAAKSRGLTVVSEVYILLSTLRIVAAERQAFSDWESPDDPELNAYIEKLTQAGLLSAADFFICPSQAVRDDLVANWRVDGARTAVVPYGMDPSWLELPSQTVPGRVLMVGTADLRKGIHYLASASTLVAEAGHQMEFRVAGHVTPQIAQRPECRSLQFLGRVPRDRIASEFQQADIFVLPSLAEGSAEVTYEALAAGVPVVTTAASGSVVRDGIDGQIVPERDPAALALAIAGIVADRDRRAAFAAAARERARDFTWKRYGQRLLEALQRCNLPT